MLKRWCTYQHFLVRSGGGSGEDAGVGGLVLLLREVGGVPTDGRELGTGLVRFQLDQLLLPSLQD